MKNFRLLIAAAFLICGTARADVLSFDTSVFGIDACTRLFAMPPSEKQEFESALKNGDRQRSDEIIRRGGLRVQACLAELRLTQAALAAARVAAVVAEIGIPAGQK